MLNAGQVVDGRFVVEGLVGQGGLAEVYRVRHAELGSLHALKLLAWKKKQLEERLILEGRIQAQLRHPNIVAVTDLVRHEGQVGLLMEFIEHESLDDYLARSGPLSPDHALELMAGIVSGVAAAHDAGVLHRDLKPANVLLDKNSAGLTPKVADFGIAKVVEDLQEGLTAVGTTMGTPGYLAPEQILDAADVDRRADIFALGAIFYEMLAGVPAFADEQGEVSVRSTLEGNARSLSDHVPDLEPGLVAAVHRALARERDERFADCRGLAAALFEGHPKLLARIGGGGGASMLSLDGGSTRTLDRPAVGPATSAKPPKPPGPSTSGNVRQAGAALIGLGLLGALLLVALLGALLVNGLAKGDRVGTPAQVPVAELDAPTPAPTEGADDPGPGGEEIEVPRAEDPPPVAPSATPASPPGGGVPDEDVPEAPARSKPAEGASVATEPLEEPGVLEGGAVDDAADGVVAVVPITNEEALPEVAVPAAPVPVLDSALLVGAWRGEADGRPIELRITAIDGTALRGELTFYQGPTARTLPAAGSVDALTGAVFVESGAFLLRGKATDASMSGTYKAGKRTAPWSLARSR